MTISWPKYIFVFVSICLWGLAMGALSVYFQPHKDLRHSKADFVFTPTEFSETASGKDSTDLKIYIDKIIEIIGTPTRVMPSTTSSILVYETENFEISAAMDDGILVESDQFHEKFKIACFCTGIEPSDGLFPGIIQLNRCVVK